MNVRLIENRCFGIVALWRPPSTSELLSSILQSAAG